MTLKEIITKYGLKRSYVQNKMEISKAGLHNLLNKGMSVDRANQMRTVLEQTGKGILREIKKN